MEELVLPEGLKSIGEYAFRNQPLLRCVALPSTLTSVGRFAFVYCEALGEFTGPCPLIRDGRSLVDADGSLLALAGSGITDYTTPADVTSLGSGALAGFPELRSVTFSQDLKNLYSDTFFDCRKLEFFYGSGASEDHHCLVLFDDYLAKVTPVLPEEYAVPDCVTRIFQSAFEDNVSTRRLVVPDGVVSIGNYCFRDMSQLQSLQLGASLSQLGAQSLRGCRRLEHLYLRAGSPPAYTPDGDDTFFGHSGLTIHIPAGTAMAYRMAAGWSRYYSYMEEYSYPDLPGEDAYQSKDYSKDGTVKILQKAGEGGGIPLVLMGDAFSDRQMDNTVYDSVMQRMMEAFFSEEPFATYRHLFNVYEVRVVSATEGYARPGQALGTHFVEGTEVDGDADACKRYALKAVGEQALDNTLILVAMNAPEYAGTCKLYPTKNGDAGEGLAIAYLPLGPSDDVFSQVLCHEAGGHGFGKLADEYDALEDEIPAAEKASLQELFPYGWWANIDFTSDGKQVKWARFLEDARYNGEQLGCYQGACNYKKGVWRPSQRSIMRYNEGGFNAPSREAIWYRLHRLAYGSSWTYSHEDFVTYDAVNRAGTKAAPAAVSLPPLPSPRIVWPE